MLQDFYIRSFTTVPLKCRFDIGLRAIGYWGAERLPESEFVSYSNIKLYTASP